MPDPNNNNAAAIIEAMEKYYESKTLELKGPVGDRAAVAVALPRGIQLQSVKPLLDEWLPRPERKRGTAKLLALESLIAHANRFKTRYSAAFVNDGEAPYMVVVYDYHEPNQRDDEGGTMLGEPDWLQHRALYQFPLSDEWKAWREATATDAMNQSDFAEFLEDRIGDVVDPTRASSNVTDYATQLGLELASPSKLMAISRNLSIRVESKATQAVNLTSGETQIAYEEEHKDGNYAPIKVPGAFAIAIPVFRNGALYSIGVRLRYRLHDRKILWWVSLHNIERILAHAIDEACRKFADDTAVPLYYGEPEKG